jgi:hypothetical protein
VEISMAGVLRTSMWISGFVVAAAGCVLAYMGAFSRIVIEERTVGPFHFVYKESTSTTPSEVGAITTELDRLLRHAGVSDARPLDIFYPAGEAPNEIGFALQRRDDSLLARLGTGVKTKNLPPQRCMVTRFPWKNRLSFLVGFIRVDPALRKHRQQHGYRQTPALALNEGPTIAYMQPIVSEADAAAGR